MEHVAIPTGFFLSEAKHEYYDYRTRLIAELLQNSLDAGSSVIRLSLTDIGYSCEDNGKGMTKERMVSALLTMGGSEKERGSTGGFGAAKKLLLFAHSSFSITSNNTAVEGSGLSYRFVEVKTKIEGTKVSAVYDPAFRGAGVKELALTLLSKCDFRGRAKVYVDGELFTNYSRFPEIRIVEGLGTVYGSKSRNGNELVYVRHNGLYMFSRVVSNLGRSMILEVEGSSVEVFTQNRDNFRGTASVKFDGLISEMTIDKEGFAKTRARKFVLTGIQSFISAMAREVKFTTKILDAMLELKNTVADSLSPTAFLATLKDRVGTVSADDKVVFEQMDNFGKRVVFSDFHFNLADSSFNKVPWWFVPNTGKKKFTEMAALWKVCIREVLKANNIEQNFVIGFTFDSQAVATHSRTDGVSCYMVNPKSDKIDTGTKQEKVLAMLTTAVHEVVHSQSYSYHDESFVLKFHELLVPTLTTAPTWRQLVKMSKNEKV